MSDEFKASKNLCMVAAMVLPLSEEQQEWVRMGGDAGNVFKESFGLEKDNKLLYGTSVATMHKFFDALNSSLILVYIHCCMCKILNPRSILQCIPSVTTIS